MTLVEDYARCRPQYEAFVDKIKTILKESLASEDLKYQSIDGRAKTIDSFSRKAQKKLPNGAAKYENPLEQITDLAGTRIILYTLEDVQKTCDFLEPIFAILEKKNIGEEREAEGRFGYQSIHYLVGLPDGLLIYPHYAPYKGLRCEIQVRTVLQHAWAEIEHDVQYNIKTQLRSLAGLLEIADREFQAIQDTDIKLKSSVHEALQQDLTRDALLHTTDSSSGEGQTSQSVRELVHLRRYSDAIQIYDQKVREMPSGHTLYIGRAKAKFLSGDVAGALADLDFASTLNADDGAIEHLRKQMVEGNTISVPAPLPMGPYHELTNRGHLELEAGNGRSAFDLYSEAEAAGGSIPFSRFNRAMACVVASDYDGARLSLDGLQLRSGTPMEINIIALSAILNFMQGNDVVAEELVGSLASKKASSDYSFSLSTTRHLERGLAHNKMGEVERRNVTKVFDVLKG